MSTQAIIIWNVRPSSLTILDAFASVSCVFAELCTSCEVIAIRQPTEIEWTSVHCWAPGALNRDLGHYYQASQCGLQASNAA